MRSLLAAVEINVKNVLDIYCIMQYLCVLMESIVDGSWNLDPIRNYIGNKQQRNRKTYVTLIVRCHFRIILIKNFEIWSTHYVSYSLCCYTIFMAHAIIFFVPWFHLLFWRSKLHLYGPANSCMMIYSFFLSLDLIYHIIQVAFIPFHILMKR